METYTQVATISTVFIITTLLTTHSMAMSGSGDAKTTTTAIVHDTPRPPNAPGTITVCEKETTLSAATQNRQSRSQCLNDILYEELDPMPQELIDIIKNCDSYELKGECALKVRVNAIPTSLTILSNGLLAYASAQHRQIVLLNRLTLQFITPDTPTKRRKNHPITYLGANRFAYPTQDMIKIVTVEDATASGVQAETKSYTRCFSRIEDGVFATGEIDGAIRLRNARTGACIDTFPKDGRHCPCCLALWPNKQLIVGDYSGSIQILYFAGTPQSTSMLDQHKKSITCLARLSDTLLASGSKDGAIKIWYIKTQECIRTLVGHRGGVNCLTPLGNQLASGSDDGTVIVWDLETGKCTVLDVKAPVLSMCQLPEGPLVVGAGDRTVQIWR
jgi:WD40 repeat protein